MVWYLKTYCPDKILLPLLKREIYINNLYAYADPKLAEFLKREYKTNVKAILSHLYSNIKIEQIADGLHQIYIIDEPFGEKAKLNDLLKILEYGSLDIRPNYIISKVMRMSLLSVKNDLGGI